MHGTNLREFGHFGSKIANCEYSALKLGSDMADVFNAPIYDEDWDQRTHQDFIAANLGFAPWMTNGVHNSGGKTLTGRNAKEIAEKARWLGTDIDRSPYAVLNHKWIYMFGDSTTRQVWASFAASFQGNNFERNAKEWTRHYCGKQEHRVLHPKGGHFEQEGWGGPCGVNEVTCHVSGFGEGGLLSFDWKHFPYEDYDEWLWSDEGPWIKGFHGEGNRRPDVLTVQFGMHSCWHASPQGLYSKDLTVMNTTMLEDHLAGVHKLMAAIRRAVDHPGPPLKEGENDRRKPVTVVIVTSGSSGMGENGTSIDDCILRFNRVAERAAHDQGFAVLERGEIERRLMYKSVYSESPILAPDMHLPQPGQNIIATCLTHLFTCLNATARSTHNNNNSSSSVHNLASGLGHDRKRHRRSGPAPPPRPLHSPPAG